MGNPANAPSGLVTRRTGRMEKLETIKKMLGNIYNGRDIQYTKQQREDAMFFLYGFIMAAREGMKIHQEAAEHYNKVNSGDPEAVRDEAMKCLELGIRKMPNPAKLFDMEHDQVRDRSIYIKSYNDLQDIVRGLPEEGTYIGGSECLHDTMIKTGNRDKGPGRGYTVERVYNTDKDFPIIRGN